MQGTPDAINPVQVCTIALEIVLRHRTLLAVFVTLRPRTVYPRPLEANRTLQKPTGAVRRRGLPLLQVQGREVEASSWGAGIQIYSQCQVWDWRREDIRRRVYGILYRDKGVRASSGWKCPKAAGFRGAAQLG